MAFMGVPDSLVSMPSKQALGVIVSFLSSIAFTFTPLPVPDRVRFVLMGAAWLATAFFSGAWANEHSRTRLFSPIEKRERLDRLVRRGEVYFNRWTAGKRPRLRTKIWMDAAGRFVKRHFSLKTYDAFVESSHSMGSDETTTRRIRLFSSFSGKPTEFFKLGTDFVTQLGALKELRSLIRD